MASKGEPRNPMGPFVLGIMATFAGSFLLMIGLLPDGDGALLVLAVPVLAAGLPVMLVGMIGVGVAMGSRYAAAQK